MICIYIKYNNETYMDCSVSVLKDIVNINMVILFVFIVRQVIFAVLQMQGSSTSDSLSGLQLAVARRIKFKYCRIN